MRIKFFLSFAVVILTSLLYPVAAMADDDDYHGETYCLDEIGVEVTLPSYLQTVTRDSDFLPLAYNSVADLPEFIDMMTSSDIYLSSASTISSPFYEYVVSMTSDASTKKVGDLRNLNDAELADFIDGLKDSRPSAKYSAIGRHIAGNVLYVVANYTDNSAANTVYVRQYVTIVGGNAYSIAQSSSESTINSEMRFQHRWIIDHMRYEDELSTDNPEGNFPVDFSNQKVQDNISFEEMEVNFSVPEGFYTVTKDSKVLPDELSSQFTDTEAYWEVFDSNDVYLNIVSLEPFYEIIVIIKENYNTHLVKDFRELTKDEIIDSTTSEVIKSQVTGGTQYSNRTVYSAENASYYTYGLKTDNLTTMNLLNDSYDFMHKSPTYYCEHYSTVVGGRLYGITLSTTDGSVTDDMKAQLRWFVDHIHYTNTDEVTLPKTSKEYSGNSTISIVFASVVALIIFGIVISKVIKRQNVD